MDKFTKKILRGVYGQIKIFLKFSARSRKQFLPILTKSPKNKWEKFLSHVLSNEKEKRLRKTVKAIGNFFDENSSVWRKQKMKIFESDFGNKRKAHNSGRRKKSGRESVGKGRREEGKKHNMVQKIY